MARRIGRGFAAVRRIQAAIPVLVLLVAALHPPPAQTAADPTPQNVGPAFPRCGALGALRGRNLRGVLIASSSAARRAATVGRTRPPTRSTRPTIDRAPMASSVAAARSTVPSIVDSAALSWPGVIPSDEASTKTASRAASIPRLPLAAPGLVRRPCSQFMLPVWADAGDWRRGHRAAFWTPPRSRFRRLRQNSRRDQGGPIPFPH